MQGAAAGYRDLLVSEHEGAAMYRFELAAELGLQPLRENRSRALYGMPERLFGRYLARLLALGRSVLVVRQGEQQWTQVRGRVLAWRVVPVAHRPVSAGAGASWVAGGC